MATYQTKRCPQCHKVYERNSYAGAPSKSNRIQYGSPIKTCSFCGTMFKDDDYREIAVSGICPVDKRRVSPYTIVMSCLGFVMGILVLSKSVAGGLVLLFGAAFLFFLEYSGYDKRQAALKQEEKASEARLRDVSYARALQSLGYAVPEKYLSGQAGGWGADVNSIPKDVTPVNHNQISVFQKIAAWLVTAGGCLCALYPIIWAVRDGGFKQGMGIFILVCLCFSGIGVFLLFRQSSGSQIYGKGMRVLGAISFVLGLALTAISIWSFYILSTL